MVAVNNTAVHLKMKSQGILQWLASTHVSGYSKQWWWLVFRNVLILKSACRSDSSSTGGHQSAGAHDQRPGQLRPAGRPHRLRPHHDPAV